MNDLKFLKEKGLLFNQFIIENCDIPKEIQIGYQESRKYDKKQGEESILLTTKAHKVHQVTIK